MQAEPTEGMLVTNGRRDFRVHFVRGGQVYGARYPSRFRGDVPPEELELTRVPLGMWRTAEGEVVEPGAPA